MTDETLGPLPEPVVLTRHIDTGIAIYGHTADQMRTYAAAQVAAERERCAKLIEAHEASRWHGTSSYHAGLKCAARLLRA